ncbi:MAG: hypothetical protein OHK005_15470 [Candidatus Methylacidiphilales bacterium]
MNVASSSSLRLIAIVNDHDLQRNVLGAILREAGHRVVSYSSAAEALAAFVESPPDLVITDLNMPGIDGWHFCRLLRQHVDGRLHDIPVLAVSATYNREEAAQLALEMGADGFLTLPVQAKSLIAEVDRLLQASHVGPSLRVLLVMPERALAPLWIRAFQDAGHHAFLVEDPSISWEELKKKGPFDAAVLELGSEFQEGLNRLKDFVSFHPGLGVATVSGDADPALAVEAIQNGAGLHLHKPLDPRYLVTVVERLRQDHALVQVQQLLKQKSDALQDAMRRLRLAVENANVGLWIWDLTTNTVEYSPEWKKQLGYDESEISDAFSEWERRLHPEDREAAVAYVRRFLESKGEVYQQEFRLRHKNGSYRTILAQGSLVRSPEGQAIQLIGTHLDLTEFKRLEEERFRFERDLHHAQKLESLGVLAGGIAHDFNNLLMAVSGQLELAQLDLEPSSPPATAIAEAQMAVARASDLTRQLLVYSGRARQQVQDLDLNTLVSDNLRLFRAAVPKQIGLEWNPASSLPVIRADIGQLQQVVMNLITNAAESIQGSDGNVSVCTGHGAFSAEDLLQSRLGDHPSPGNYVWVEVTDNGCGMDQVTAKRIFDPFFTTKTTGRGLGMASVLGILRSHRGAILLDSEPGKGTTIRVLFPVAHQIRNG